MKYLQMTVFIDFLSEPRFEFNIFGFKIHRSASLHNPDYFISVKFALLIANSEFTANIRSIRREGENMNCGE